jgi:type II secretory pathway component GspD/PulD (secretin)
LIETASNIETEMNSGSLINIRLTGEKTACLQEINTGVTLRVTPRLISSPGDNRSKDEILLNVNAETSIPMAKSNIDEIPQINSQRARSEGIVRQGQPFLLAGLIKERQSTSQFGESLLKNLPLIGWLFCSEENASQFDHVLVFVIPTCLSFYLIKKLPGSEKIHNSSKD